MPKKMGLKIKLKFDHFFVSSWLTCFLFLFSFVFTLNFNKHGCSEGEEEESILLLGLHVCLYMLVKHVADIQTFQTHFMS